jgi:hypothetical protein
LIIVEGDSDFVAVLRIPEELSRCLKCSLR